MCNYPFCVSTFELSDGVSGTCFGAGRGLRGGEGIPGVADEPVLEPVHVGCERAAASSLVAPGHGGAGGGLLQQPPPPAAAEDAGCRGRRCQGPEADPAAQLDVRAGDDDGRGQDDDDAAADLAGLRVSVCGLISVGRRRRSIRSMVSRWKTEVSCSICYLCGSEICFAWWSGGGDVESFAGR